MNCEEVMLSAMALADGEATPLSRLLIENHLAACRECREELHALVSLNKLWDAQRRNSSIADVWPRVQKLLPFRRNYRWVPVLVALLLVFRFAEFVPDHRLKYWIQILPLLAAAAVFAFLGQNPFEIKTELRSQEE